ncbi:MAG TPA: hypothetical protein VFY29_05240 [Terriglobia bacterium]|nr:hypothetical protein [Terriglobia bacterium]
MNSLHKVRIAIAGTILLALVAGTLAYGLDYYRLDAKDRVFHEKHRQLRPSGRIGIDLGMLGVMLFFGLYGYPIRKKWKWLQRFGKTKNWLDFHILLGIAAPLVITLHSSFKFQGLAGVAYLLMMIVMASGFAGRYIYGQIPRSLNETTLTLAEIEALAGSARTEIARQKIVSPAQMERFLVVPDKSRVERMSMTGAVIAMVFRDAIRPFQTAALRRAAAPSMGDNVRTLFGFLPSPHTELESVIGLARRQARLAQKMAFLERAHRLFQLWHVIHRPFSYSFAVLACLHVTFAVLMGFY